MKKISATAIAVGLFAAQFGLAGAAAADARTACKGDFQRLCSNVSPGGGRVLQCLKEHESDLSSQCKEALVDAKAKREQGKTGEAAGTGGSQ